jgi:chromosome segregation ATPase
MLQETRQNLIGKNSDAQVKLKEYQTRLTQLNSEKSGLEFRLDNLKSKEDSWQTQSQQLTASVQQLSDAVQEKEKLISDLKLAQGELLRKQETEQIQQLAINDSLDKKISEFTEVLSNKDGQVNGLKRELESLREAKKNLEERVQSLQSSRVSFDEESAQELSEKKSLLAQLERLRADLSRQTQINNALSRNLSQLRAKLNSQQQDRSGIIQELKRLRESKEEIEAELRILEAQGSARNIAKPGDARGAGASYQELKNKVLQLTDSLKKRELQIGLKERELNAKQEEIATLRENLESIGEEKDNLFLFLKDKEKSITDLSQALAQMEDQVNALQEEVLLAKERQSRTQGRSLLGINPEKKKAEDLRRKVKVILDSGM